jgi:hypothetical protein
MYIKSPTENGILEKNNSCIGFIFWKKHSAIDIAMLDFEKR